MGTLARLKAALFELLEIFGQAIQEKGRASGLRAALIFGQDSK